MCILSAFDVMFLEPDPDSTFRSLLNKYFIHFSEVTTYLNYLFFDIYEEGRISLKVNNGGIKEIEKEQTDRWRRLIDVFCSFHLTSSCSLLLLLSVSFR